MPVTVIASFPTKAEESDTFHDTLASVLPDTRAFEGCIGVTTHRGLDDPSLILLIEEWESREKYLAYFQWRVDTGLLDAIGPMLAGEPVTSFYSNTDG
jgi:quinol monooxygenase YgiN